MRPREAAVVGAAAELIWRASRVISIATRGLDLARLADGRSAWRREQALRRELARTLVQQGRIFWFVAGADGCWVRLGYTGGGPSEGLLSAEFVGGKARLDTGLRRRLDDLGPDWASGPDWHDPKRSMVRAERDDRATPVGTAAQWLTQRVEDLIAAGLLPPRDDRAVDLAEVPPAAVGIRSFSVMQSSDPKLGRHLSITLALAANQSSGPLTRAVLDREPPAYPDLYFYNTGVDALGCLPPVLVEVDGKIVRCVDGVAQPGERSWQEIHDAIAPEDGGIWQDIRIFLWQSGLALRASAHRLAPGDFSVARDVLAEVSVVLGRVVDATPSAKWDWPLDASPRPKPASKLSERWARMSVLAILGNHARDVKVSAGWFPIDGRLSLQVRLTAGEKYQVLRDLIRTRTSSFRLDQRGWALEREGWAALAISVDGAHPEPDRWIIERVRELEDAGLLVDFGRWGNGPELPGPWPPPHRAVNPEEQVLGRQAEHRQTLAEAQAKLRSRS